MEPEQNLDVGRIVTRRQALAGGALGLSAVVLGGYGSSRANAAMNAADRTKDALAPVLASLEAARAIPSFRAPGPAFDASSAKGKTVFFLSVLLTVPAQQDEWLGTKAAAAAAGVKAISYDGKGTTAGAVQGIQQAIAQKADVLIIDAVPSATVAAPIHAALKAGVKVIVTQERNVATGGPKIKTGYGTVAFDFIGAAQLEADWVLAHSGGKNINAVTFAVPGNPSHEDMVNTINKALHKSAKGGVQIKNEWVLAADWPTRLATLTQSLMTSDPTINYMIPVVDGQALYIVPALNEIGKQDQVKITGFNGTPAVMSLLKKGEVVGADIGSSFIWEGWANMDQALRALTGHAPAADDGAALRLFDKTNIGKINVNAPQQGAEWYDTATAINGYKKLWGLA